MEAEAGGAARSVIAIPKDPASEHAVFLTGLPYCLQKRISTEEWRSIVQGLNDVIVRRDAPSPHSILKLLFIIPMLVETSSYDSDVEQYLRSVNRGLSSRGIFIRHPAYTGYTELEVEYPDALDAQNVPD